MINVNAGVLPERGRFLLRERMEGCCFFSVLVFIIFSPPRALSFISHPHTTNRWGFYLSSQLSISPSSFLLFLSPPIRPRLLSSSPLFISPSQRVIKSNLSPCQRMEAATAAWSSRVHRLMILGCVPSPRVSPSAVPRPRPRPALFHKHLGDSVIFSAVFTSADQTSR